jgi:hypothetical protein
MAKDFLSMASPSPQDAEHHGVKGMKWGIRNDRGHEGQKAKTKVIAKADQKFEKNIAAANKGRLTPELHNAVVTRMNARVQGVNDSDKYRGIDMDTATGKIKSDYEKDMRDAIVTSFEDGVREIYGSNASGTKRGVYNSKTDSIDIVEKDVQHAALPDVPNVTAKLTRDKLGQVASIEVVPFEMEHSNLDGENYLAHFGVKGMKWGIRKSDSSGSSRGGSKSIPKASANETHGEKYNRLRSQIKTHGPNSVSTEDLNFVNARTEAIAKINKMNIASPGWLTDTSKVILQETTKTLMKDLAVKAGKQFIVKPLIKGK